MMTCGSCSSTKSFYRSGWWISPPLWSRLYIRSYCRIIYFYFPFILQCITHVYVYLCTCTTLHRLNVVSLCTLLAPAFNASLELQGDCSDQLTLICRHSDNGNDPLWMHNDTPAEGGNVLGTAFPGTVYTVQALTEHIATITGVDTVRALDGYVIQCAYTNLGNLVKSNAVKFSFIPPGQS